VHVRWPVKSTCQHSRQQIKVKENIVVIRTTQGSQGSVLEAATDRKKTLVFADLFSTTALVTAESGADIVDTVILAVATDWTNSLEFADSMSTVAVVRGFGACAVASTVVSPATT